MTTNPVYVERVLDTLRTEGDFMSAINIHKSSGLESHDVITTLDQMYDRLQILKRFMLLDVAIIVDVTEVRNPEVGCSRHLDNLLKGIGVDRKNWTEVVASYGLDRGWSGETPESFDPPVPLLGIDRINT